MPEHVITRCGLGSSNDGLAQSKVGVPSILNNLTESGISAIEVGRLHVKLIVGIEEWSKEDVGSGELDIWKKFNSTALWAIVSQAQPSYFIVSGIFQLPKN